MAKLLDDSGSDSDDGGVTIQNGDLKVNQEYARRFDYNKKREELRRLEDKFGSSAKKRKRANGDEGSESQSEESSSESEDDSEAELATETLDAEIQATLNAIKTKDPRVYDKSITFYTQLEDGADGPSTKAEKEKPLFLRDYHRETLLNGADGTAIEDASELKTYDQEQADLKASIVKQIHDAAADEDNVSNAEDSGDEDGFLKAKEKPKQDGKRARPQLDVENADRDPETFLSNFMASRAWTAPERTQLQPFESDDEEEERRAEVFEEAYNLRFEDPTKSNEKLMSHARDLASKYSVRREEKTTRQKKRDAEKAKQEAANKELKEEKARLRKLRIEEMEEKIRRIKRAAGISHKTLDDKAWSKFVDNDWDDSRWDQEMAKHFGEDYYAAEDAVSDEASGDEEDKSKKKKLKKPKWDDDIDIKDLIPDFEDEEEVELSNSDVEEAETAGGPSQKKSSKELKKQRAEQKKAARIERQKIEQIVDDQLKFELPFSGTKSTGGFRYRESSPVTYGLTARDILMADDSQLNQFAGLKKLASFRDPEKKSKDQKKLGKKARLRQWRKDTFGDEEGPKDQDFVAPDVPMGGTTGDGVLDNEEGGVDIREGSQKKRRRSKKKKVATE